MTRMIGLDTSVLVRYLTQDEPQQSRRANASISLAAGKGERCFIGSIVLCELVWVLRGAYGFAKEDLVSVLDKLLSTVEFTIEDKDLARRALEDYRSGRGDFSDYLIGWRNRRAGCEETLTFDAGLHESDLFAAPRS